MKKTICACFSGAAHSFQESIKLDKLE